MDDRAHSIVGYRPEGRPENDFYPTPPVATLALLGAEKLTGEIWEPACGDGAISKVLESAGHQVISTDLVYRGYGKGGVDFLWSSELLAPTIVTNPPFSLLSSFIDRAMCLGAEKLCLLLKLTALEGVERSGQLERTGLTRVHVFRSRLSMSRNGNTEKNRGMIAFAWFVWDRGYKGPVTLGWI